MDHGKLPREFAISDPVVTINLIHHGVFRAYASYLMTIAHLTRESLASMVADIYADEALGFDYWIQHSSDVLRVICGDGHGAVETFKVHAWNPHNGWSSMDVHDLAMTRERAWRYVYELEVIRRATVIVHCVTGDRAGQVVFYSENVNPRDGRHSVMKRYTEQEIEAAM